MQNSDFRRDAWGRLTRTASFVGTTTYGTTEAAERAGARVRKIHRMLGAMHPGTAPTTPRCRWGCPAPRVAHLAYDSLPRYAHELYGRPASAPATATRRLRATGALLRAITARLRWQLPPKHILRAKARLGPAARPAPYKLGPWTAILDRPGEGGADCYGGGRRDGGQHADPGPVPAAGADRARRHGRGVAGAGRVSGPSCRRQVPQATGHRARPLLHPRPAGEVPARGQGGRRAPAPRGDRRARLR